MRLDACTQALLENLPRINLSRGRYFVQVPEGHLAFDALLEFGILPQCVQVGTGGQGRPKVYLYRGEDWEQVLATLLPPARAGACERGLPKPASGQCPPNSVEV